MNKQIVEDLIRYFKNKAEINSVYIYGSYAEGKNRPDSDLDVAIFLSKDIKKNHLLYRSEIITELQQQLKIKIDVIILNESNYMLRAEVFRKGKLIYEKDTEKRSVFQAISMGFYYDYKKFFDFYQFHLVKKIKVVGLG
jgi:hypothetical protein